MSEQSVSVQPAASGDWNVYIFDGTVTHFRGAYATKDSAEARAEELRMQ